MGGAFGPHSVSPAAERRDAAFFNTHRQQPPRLTQQVDRRNSRQDARVPLPPLPHPLDFSVYGLDASFTGARWLDAWNPAGPTTAAGDPWVTDVDLGHGSWDRSGDFVLVFNSKRRLGAESDVEQVLGNACVAMLHATAPRDADSRFWRDGAERVIALAQSQDGPEWRNLPVVVDGAMVPFKKTGSRETWVAGGVHEGTAIAMLVRGYDADAVRLEPADLSQYPPIPVATK